MNRIQGLFRALGEVVGTFEGGALQDGNWWGFMPRDWVFHSVGWV